MTTLLSSSLIGGDLNRMYGLSSFGRLYRISRLNSLTLQQAVDVMGIPNCVQNHLRSYESFLWSADDFWDHLPKVTLSSD